MLLCNNYSMQKRSSKDTNVIASNIVSKATDESNIVNNPAAVALGRLGGLKDGKARAKKLSPERRRGIAVKASKARRSKVS